jgi:hypothetical protein
MSKLFPGELAPELRARLYRNPAFPGVPPGSSVVIVGCSPALPDTSLMHGGLVVVLSHDAGLTWPDAIGETLARRATEQSGSVLLCFSSFADALGCLRLLRAEGVQ